MMIPKLLTIDDDPHMPAFIESLLGHEEFELNFAPDGETGLEMARRIRPDVVMLDLMMPGMDGFEV